MTKQSVTEITEVTEETQGEPELFRCPITHKVTPVAEAAIRAEQGWNGRLNRPAWVLVSREGAEQADLI